MAGSTPSARSPSLVKASCSAVVGSGFVATADVTGAVRDPCARRGRIGHAQQKEARGGELAVSEAHETLHVREVDRRVHSSFSQSITSASSGDAASSPTRMRWLRARSCSVRPG